MRTISAMIAATVFAACLGMIGCEKGGQQGGQAPAPGQAPSSAPTTTQTSPAPAGK